ncbi:MAG: response regulator transcription factor [Ferruginibacter sp.]
MKNIKLAIVDDHNLFRKGIIKLINLGDVHGKYSVLFEAENGNDLIEKLDKKNLPNIILMDIDMPDMDGYQAVEWLKENYPDISILIISMFETEEAIIKMLRFGIKGYLSKDIEVEDMHKALEAISNKGFYYADSVTETMAKSFQTVSSEFSTSNNAGIDIGMSENERIFLGLACTELTYSQIADKMILSPKTIENYRESLFAKFKVKNRVCLAMFAVKHGLVKL